MAFTVETNIEREFEVAAPFHTVFDLLESVPDSASHFPNVDALVDLGGNAYRWEMKKIGIESFSVQTIYGCKYAADRNKGTIKWTPVKGEGNANVKGKWAIKAIDGEHTRLKLQTDGEIELPFPRLTKMMVGPFVVREFEKMMDKYVENLTAALETKKGGKKKAKKG